LTLARWPILLPFPCSVRSTRHEVDAVASSSSRPHRRCAQSSSARRVSFKTSGA
jgi:hypothetical protein